MIAKLIRERAADWQRRCNKWHRVLETERAWERRGSTWPIVCGALAACLTMLAGAKWTPYISIASGLVCALIGWRASTARQKLSSSQADKVWVVADRLAEQYKGMLSLLETCGDKQVQLLERLLAASDHLENGARLGLPESVQDALRAARKVLDAAGPAAGASA
jgi:hypothetical protein